MIHLMDNKMKDMLISEEETSVDKNTHTTQYARYGHSLLPIDSIIMAHPILARLYSI